MTEFEIEDDAYTGEDTDVADASAPPNFTGGIQADLVPMVDKVEIIRTLNPQRQRARLDWYMGQVDRIMAASAQIIPSGYPTELKQRRAAVEVALMYGAELGMPPISALRAVYFVPKSGRCALHSDGPPAVAFASGLVVDKWEACVGYTVLKSFAEGGPLLQNLPASFRGAVQLVAVEAMEQAIADRNYHCAISLVWRKGMSMPVVYAFDMVDANRAGLLSKGGDTWSKHTRRMLLARARTFACRDAVPEVYQGLPTIEEAEEIEARDKPGDATSSPDAKSVDSIIADAGRAANMRAAEDIEVSRQRTKAILRTKYKGAAALAWQVCLTQLRGGAEPDTTDAWEACGRFLEDMDPQDPRIRALWEAKQATPQQPSEAQDPTS